MEKCRLCYRNSSPKMCRHIFNTKFEPPIWKIIEQLSNLIVTKTDPYTKNICSPCFNKLVKYSDFRTQILDTDYRLQHQKEQLLEKTSDNCDYYEEHYTPTRSDNEDFIMKEEQIEIEEHSLKIEDESDEESNHSSIVLMDNEDTKDTKNNNDKIPACYTSPNDNSNETNESQSIKCSTDVKIIFNRNSIKTDGSYTISTNNNDLRRTDNDDMIISDENERSTAKDIMSKMKLISKTKKTSIAAKQEMIENDVFKLPSISETTSGLCDKMEAGGSSNVTPTEENKTTNKECQNCKQCFCKFWRNELTAEYVQGMENQLYYIKNFFIMRNCAPTAFETVKMELHPGTNILVEKKRILIAIAKANSNQRAMVRNLLKECISELELLKLGTAQKLCDIKPEIPIAITEYLNTNHNASINSTLFKQIVNSYIRQVRLDQKLTPQEREAIKLKKRAQMHIKRLQKRGEL